MGKFYFSNLGTVIINGIQYANISTRVHIKSLFQGNEDIFSVYKLRPDLNLEQLAFELYGDRAYYWVTLLSNDTYDWLYDLPLTEAELKKLVQKYMITAPTGTNPEDILAYFSQENETKGIIYSLKPALFPDFLNKVKKLYGN